jgi:hypothetical protein
LPTSGQYTTKLSTNLNCVVYNGNFEVRLSNPELTFDKYATDEYHYQEIIATLGMQSLVDYSGVTAPTSGYYITVDKTAGNISKDGSAGNNMYKVTKPDNLNAITTYTVKLYTVGTKEPIETIDLVQTYKESYNATNYSLKLDVSSLELKLNPLDNTFIDSSSFSIDFYQYIKNKVLTNSDSERGYVDLEAPGEDWTGGDIDGPWFYDNEKQRFDIYNLPESFRTPGTYNFTIVWKASYESSAQVFDRKIFTLKIKYAEVNYEIETPLTLDVTHF